MSNLHRGRPLYELAKKYAALAIDTRAALADCHPSRRDRADVAVMKARSLASDLEELAVDASAIEAKAAVTALPKRENKPGDPPGKVLTNGKLRSSGIPEFREPSSINGRGSDWRTTPVDALGDEFADGLFDSDIDTAGEAWDLIESGAMVEAYKWPVEDVVALHAKIVAIRHEAGDPAPFIELVPESATKVMDLPHLDAPGGPDWRPAAPVATVPEGMFTFEVIEKPGQKAGGHIQFWAASLPDAIEHARINWPSMLVRPCPPERDLANQIGSDGRPKTLPETIEKYGKKGPGRPPVEKPGRVPMAVIRSWRVFNLDGISLATVESSSEEGAKKKARKLHPGVRLGCVVEVRSLSY